MAAYKWQHWLILTILSHLKWPLLRKIEGATRRDRLRNTIIQERLGVTKDIIARIQAFYTAKAPPILGYVVRMHQPRHPNLALEGYMHGKRNRGRPKRGWLGGIKEDMESLNMTIQEATCTRTAQDRASWRSIIKELPLCASQASPRQ